MMHRLNAESDAVKRGRVPPRVVPAGGISHESAEGAVPDEDIPPKHR